MSIESEEIIIDHKSQNEIPYDLAVNEPIANANPKRYKRRIGDRPDGRKLRSLNPMNKISPYIMKTRNTSANKIEVAIDIENVEHYIRKKRSEGLKGFGLLHVMLAVFVRTASQRPGINRFVSGQKIYARNDLQIMMTIKKEMKLDAQETVVKAFYNPGDSVETVYKKFTTLVDDNRATGDQNDMDGMARILNFIPGLVLKFAIWLLGLLDYFGILPKKLLNLSPFHGSFFITSMGSLGIPVIFHHLYDFGNVPIFCAYGAKRTATVINKDGEPEERKYVDFTFTLDERICDGHYFASALKLMLDYLKNPEQLDEKITVINDID